MPTYISLMSYTDGGIQAVRQSPRRLDAAKKMLEDMGGTFRDFFMTIGRVRSGPDLRGAGRCRLGAFSVAARVPGQCPDHDHEGVPGGCLSRGHRLARLAL